MTDVKLVAAVVFVTATVLVCAVRPAAQSAAVYEPPIPKGIPTELWRRSIPPRARLTREKVALGAALYFDKTLSADGTVSCATCHDPASAFADHNAVAVGVGDRTGTRNAPTVLNVMFSPRQFWDGRAGSLEEQVMQPLVNPAEMGVQSYDVVVARVAANPEYRRQFRQVFGRDVTIASIAEALAAYERTQLSGNSPFDRFIAGDPGALTEPQRRGWELFKGRALCADCHTFSASSPFFTDFGFHNTGVAARGKNFAAIAARARAAAGGRPSAGPAALAHVGEFSDLGRFLVTKRMKDIGAFKTPSLRDVELTAPYMHNGELKTLLDVVRFYSLGGGRNSYLDARVRPLNLTEAEMSDLVEFMRALTSDDVLRQAQTATPQARTTTGP